MKGKTTNLKPSLYIYFLSLVPFFPPSFFCLVPKKIEENFVIWVILFLGWSFFCKKFTFSSLLITDLDKQGQRGKTLKNMRVDSEEEGRKLGLAWKKKKKIGVDSVRLREGEEIDVSG